MSHPNGCGGRRAGRPQPSNLRSVSPPTCCAPAAAHLRGDVHRLSLSTSEGQQVANWWIGNYLAIGRCKTICRFDSSLPGECRARVPNYPLTGKRDDLDTLIACAIIRPRSTVGARAPNRCTCSHGSSQATAARSLSLPVFALRSNTPAPTSERSQPQPRSPKARVCAGRFARTPKWRAALSLLDTPCST